MTDNLSSLRLFSRVARTGSFTSAAQEAGLSQPSVSRIISNLENNLGVLLLARTTHAVRLTEAGEEYLARVEPILADLEEANHAVRGTGELRGRLRVGAPASFAQREVIPLLQKFMADHPKLKIDLVLTDARQDLINQAIDVAIRFGSLEDSTMIARKLGDTRRLLAASPAYLARHGTPQRPTDLVDHQIIMGPSSSGRAGWQFKRDGKVQSVRVESQLMITVNEATTVAALAGLGIVSTALWGCKADLESGSLIEILPEWSLGSIEVHALLAGGRGTKPSARVFTNYLQRHL